MFNYKIRHVVGIAINLILMTLLISIITVSCKNTKETKKNNEEIKKEEALLLKLDNTLVSMSNRFHETVFIDNKKEFLDDLNTVLEFEKKYNNEWIDFYELVDKKHKLPSSYEPSDLVPLESNESYVVNKSTLSLTKEAEKALREMGKASKEDGITLTISSSYRSYKYQDRTFKYWSSIDGEEKAERYSARPGTSQHQLGTAVDFGSIDDSFAETKQYKWLMDNAYKYGWSLSFPYGYEDVTGYKWESWHFRYIGKDACYFQKKWFGDIQQFMLEFIAMWKSL